MRGRTLNHSCIIMDEAQNTTVEQMKMFLTRIGFGSKAIVTGDISQVDLPKHQMSGLKHVQQVLSGVDGSAAQSYLTAEFTATVSILVEDDGVHHEHISIPAKKLELYCSAAMAQQAYFDFKDVTTVEISVRCVGRDEMAALNFQYRGKNSPTNVLSFESDLPAMPLDENAGGGKLLALGDLVFCGDVISTEAQNQGKSLLQHWQHLLVHGTLHLCGYDHEEESQAIEMESLEISILQTLGVSDPYRTTA